MSRRWATEDANFEEMVRRTAAVGEVASGVTGERVGTTTSAGEVRGISSSGIFARSWRGNRPAKKWCE